jgi:Mg-chelatase subunit ChlD
MVASWVRREFGAVGVTQFPLGRHLRAAQDHFRGRALLCIDVSGSMAGEPLAEAVAGGADFLSEAREAHYDIGLVLWAGKVKIHLPTTADDDSVRAALLRARAGGGTQLAPALQVAIGELGALTGDRVVCVFGDGVIADTEEAEELAAQARALGIRFVVRGLGERASRNLAQVLTPEGGEVSRTQTVREVGDLRRGIASMVADLQLGPGPSDDGRAG